RQTPAPRNLPPASGPRSRRLRPSSDRPRRDGRRAPPGAGEKIHRGVSTGCAPRKAMNHSSAILPSHVPPASDLDRSATALASVSFPTRSDLQPSAPLLLTLLRFIVALPA